MSVTIGDSILNFTSKSDKYITTFIKYPNNIDTYLDKIFDTIFPFYASRHLEYANVCGANAEFLCNSLKIDNCKLGKIIIKDWTDNVINYYKDQSIKTIESIYGSNIMIIGMSYHALVYIEIIENDRLISYVAIETTSCIPYKLQFYVSDNKEDFDKIIKTRYQCKSFFITFECKKKWWSLSGGKNTIKNNQNIKHKTNKKLIKNKNKKLLKK